MRIGRSFFLVLLLALLTAVFAPSVHAEEVPVRIAFIDSGISTKHIDASQVEQGANYVFPESDTEDRIGHGTATAGLVLGAADQSVKGVDPDALAVPLVVVDAYPSGAVKNGGAAALCQAIYDAVDRFDCRIINISLCTAEDSAELRAAAAYAEAHGVLLIAAVGNDGEEGSPYYPAAYDTVIAVGSAQSGTAARFSQNGVDLLAEGAGLSTATNKNGAGSVTVQGTSYSCALVSGLCARLLACYPELSPAEARTALFALAEDVMEPGFDARSGWGILPADLEIPLPYWDVPETLWSRESILTMKERGIMSGVGGGRFAPDRPVSRSMFTAVLYRLAGMPVLTLHAGFVDVDADAYYADAVAWASGSGIVEGYGGGRFGPNDPLTREQMVTLLWRYRGKPAADKSCLVGCSDTDEISEWAKEAFAWALGEEIIHGKGNGILDPKGIATRGETAQMIMNIENK